MPWEMQDDNEIAHVEVFCGNETDGPRIDRKSGKEVFSEFIIQDKETGEHIHMGLDEYGDTIFEKRTQR